MKQLSAFINKEYLEIVRTKKMLILIIIFILFGIMNPAIAKLTPWLMKMLSGSLADAGLTVTETHVDALTSWTQFYKNLPIALIIFILMFSSIFTLEYQKGTLINMITKGLARWKIVISKTVVMTALWTVGYWMCYLITFAYNAYYWDNHIASHLLFSAFCFYLFGIWLISLIPIVSTFIKSGSSVIIVIGGVFLIVYLLGMLPDVKKYLPVKLLDTLGLLLGANAISQYSYAIIITLLLVIFNIVAGMIRFNKLDI